MISSTKLFFLLATLLLFSFATANTLTTTSPTAHSCIPRAGLFKTWTQVQLGTPGTAANVFLSTGTNFARCFPHGLTLGADVDIDLGRLLNINLGLGALLGNPLNLVFNSCPAVTNFLPQLGAPGCLVSGLLNPIIDPVTCAGGLLAGDLLALNINAALDVAFPAFGAADFNLTGLVFVKGPCAGLSVGAVIDIASEVLSGCIPSQLAHVSLFAAANIDTCVSAINANFLEGTYVGAYLALPGFNLQANANIRLPVISANVNAAITATISDALALNANAAACLHVSLAGIQVDANVALTVGNGVYNAWRVDVGVALSLNAALRVDACAVTSLPSSITGVVDLSVNLNVDLCALVNYVLNIHVGVHAAVDIQAAILCLLNPTISIDAIISATPAIQSCHKAIVLAIVADAKLNGVGFCPAPGQWVGVVAKVNIGAGVFARVLLQVKVPALDLSITSSLCIDL